MLTPDSFSDAKNLWQPQKSDYKRKNFKGHAMVVVGYSDRKYGGSFQLMNSWGSKWGKDGFTWIKYRDFRHFIKYAYEMIPNPPPKEPIKLGGALRFIDSNGNLMGVTYNHTHHFYQMKKPYKSGTKFNFFIKNSQPAYLYAFGLDAVGKISTIFPHNKKISAFLGYKNSSIAFPSEQTYIRMDSHVGKDYFIVLYSKNRLDIEAIKYSFGSIKGSVNQRLRVVLGASLIGYNQIDFSENYIKFNHTSKPKNSAIIAVIIEFNHI